MTLEPAASLLATASFLALPVLAQLPDPNSSESVGWMVMTAAGILVIVKNASDLFRSWFIKPPSNPPDHDRYAAKAELTALRTAHEKEMIRIEHRLELWAGEIAGKLDAHVKLTAESSADVERSLGRIEGKIDSMKTQARPR